MPNPGPPPFLLSDTVTVRITRGHIGYRLLITRGFLRYGIKGADGGPVFPAFCWTRNGAIRRATRWVSRMGGVIHVNWEKPERKH